ncbi:MAG TPA: class I SAM-dependent methyltransferase [Gemmatimonadaceae bacterium]|nr:class I SAM-dependent methyltransferase [Gemmatimonadaceae bacterium]
MSEERARWQTRYSGATPASAAAGDRAPSSWVIERCLALPADGVVVDVAAGLGRHAVALAERGRRVVALDFVEDAVRVAVQRAWGVSGEVWGCVADAVALPFADGTLDLIVTVNFLDRSLFPSFARLLRPGGHLVAETYTRRHADLVASGLARAPRNPAYMLDSGELPSLVAPLRVVDGHEEHVRDEAGERWVAGVVAVRA